MAPFIATARKHWDCFFWRCLNCCPLSLSLVLSLRNVDIPWQIFTSSGSDCHSVNYYIFDVDKWQATPTTTAKSIQQYFWNRKNSLDSNTMIRICSFLPEFGFKFEVHLMRNVTQYGGINGIIGKIRPHHTWTPRHLLLHTHTHTPIQYVK